MSDGDDDWVELNNNLIKDLRARLAKLEEENSALAQRIREMEAYYYGWGD